MIKNRKEEMDKEEKRIEDTPFTEVEMFKTVQCVVVILKADWQVNNESVYVIMSKHRKTGKINTRFANQKQLEGILMTYSRLRLGGKNTDRKVLISEMN